MSGRNLKRRSTFPCTRVTHGWALSRQDCTPTKTRSGREALLMNTRGRRRCGISTLLTLTCTAHSLLPPATTAQGTRADVIRHLRVYAAPREYCAWPSVVRTRNGDLLVLFTRSEEHLGPDGAVLLSRSTDNGATWGLPSVVLDTPIDDREAGVTVLRDGRLLGHFWSTFHTRRSYEALAPGSYGRELVERWISVVEKPEYRASEGIAGPRSAVSSDGG